MPAEPLTRQTRRRQATVAVLATLGGVLIVLGILIPSVSRHSDARLAALRRFSADPHRMSNWLDETALPLLADLIDGEQMDASRLAFIPNSFVGDQADTFPAPGSLIPNSFFRGTYLDSYGPSADPWLQAMFAWDDALMAAISTDGLRVLDRDALIALQQADFVERMYQAELDSLGPVRREITVLRWVRGAQIASEGFVPVGGLLLLASGFVWLAAGAAADLNRPGSGAAERDVADDEAHAG